MKDDPALYQKLTNSIAPTVYGKGEKKGGDCERERKKREVCFRVCVCVCSFVCV